MYLQKFSAVIRNDFPDDPDVYYISGVQKLIIWWSKTKIVFLVIGWW